MAGLVAELEIVDIQIVSTGDGLIDKVIGRLFVRRQYAADVEVRQAYKKPAEQHALHRHERQHGKRVAVGFGLEHQGLVPEAVPVNLLGLLAHEKELIGSSAYVDEFPEAIRLLAEKRVRIAPLVTARVPLDQAVTRGLDALLRREEGHIKILITPR